MKNSINKPSVADKLKQGPKVMLFFIAFFFALNCFVPLPLGTIHHYQIILGLPVSYSIAGTIVFLGLAIFVQCPSRWRRKLILLWVCFILGGPIVAFYFNEARVLRRKMKQATNIIVAHRIISHENIPMDDYSKRKLFTIDRTEEILDFINSFNLKPLPPWHILLYWDIGTFTFVFENDKGVVAELVLIAPDILRWKGWRTERHASSEFRQKLVKMFLNHLPDDSGLSLPEKESRIITFVLAALEDPRAVERIKAKASHVDPKHLSIIAFSLGSCRESSAIPLLISLAKSDDLEIRRAAFSSLSLYNNPEVYKFFESSLPGEKNAEIRSRIENYMLDYEAK